MDRWFESHWNMNICSSFHNAYTFFSWNHEQLDNKIKKTKQKTEIELHVVAPVQDVFYSHAWVECKLTAGRLCLSEVSYRNILE